MEKHNRQSDTELLIEFINEHAWFNVNVVKAMKRLQDCHDLQLQDYGIFEDKNNNQD